MFKRIWQKKSVILFLIFLAHLIWRVSFYRQNYLLPFDAGHWQDRYLKSQWVRPDAVETIGDDGLYTYVGWEYIHGADPTSINPEIPPLGLYLLGWTILIFNNQNVFALLSGILVLVAFYLLNRLIFKDNFLALLPVAFFSFEPLFWQQLRAPYLDLLYLFFLLITFYFFLKKHFFSSSFFWGCFLNTKSAHSSLVLPALLFISYFFINKDWASLKKWLPSLGIIPLVTFLVYYRYFQTGHGLSEFFNLQKWIFNFYRQGAQATFGAVLPMLFFGQWQTWWQEEKIAVSEWRLTWTLLAIAFLLTVVKMKSIFKFKKITFVWGWLFIYLLFLHFIPVWPRYLLIWLPFGYNLLVYQAMLSFRRSEATEKSPPKSRF